jgi:hypothetical protein
MRNPFLFCKVSTPTPRVPCKGYPPKPRISFEKCRDQRSFSGTTQYILERLLPYSEGERTFPDRLAVFFIDEEWLTPTGVWSYADEQKERPLGVFITKNVEFNVGLADSDFE